MRPTTEVAVYSPSGSLWPLSFHVKCLARLPQPPPPLPPFRHSVIFLLFHHFLVPGRQPKQAALPRRAPLYTVQCFSLIVNAGNDPLAKPRSRRRNSGSAVLTIDHGSGPYVGVKTCLKCSALFDLYFSVFEVQTPAYRTYYLVLFTFAIIGGNFFVSYLAWLDLDYKVIQLAAMVPASFLIACFV